MPTGLVAVEPAAVRERIQQDLPILQACYELSLAKVPELGGRFMLSFDVISSGFVQDVTLQEQGCQYHQHKKGLVQPGIATTSLAKIEHVVVLTLENRSFDNLVGWLYTPELPAKTFVMPVSSQPPYYDGLAYGNFSNPNVPSALPISVPVQRGADHFTIPDPDPHEAFQYVTKQLYGDHKPVFGDVAPMNGFVRNYATVEGSTPEHIMQTYTPEQLPVLSFLARQFAISDAWFSSVPTQTQANRAFLHSGTSDGQVNNGNPFFYGSKTIFNVLSDYDVSWRVYSDSGVLPSLVRLNMTRLWSPIFNRHFQRFEQFKRDAASGRLPAYSFIEPRFIHDAPFVGGTVNSEHPPTNVQAGEQFLADVYTALFRGANWDKTVLIITFDEHGGIYDHVSPPWGAVPPDDKSQPGKQGFYFDRFGVRVATIVVSPWVDESVVFRSFSTPYDHTSILATIMDWQGIPRGELPSKRVQAAANITSVFRRVTPRKMPDMIHLPPWNVMKEQSDFAMGKRKLTDFEKGVIGAYTHYMNHLKGKKFNQRELKQILDHIKTLSDANKHIHRLRQQ
ncbi:uncharacterized protein LOC132564232 [Ylistrum balloti]|uniref:uncharacterized protein LOC132564232 n=1 Tax=Ylistrum balloti TaxID=509963 RepID=UPI002905D478|nr:uncharacterized protein LOC132564232 [Ylistrum balloti]